AEPGRLRHPTPARRDPGADDDRLGPERPGGPGPGGAFVQEANRPRRAGHLRRVRPLPADRAPGPLQPGGRGLPATRRGTFLAGMHPAGRQAHYAPSMASVPRGVSRTLSPSQLELLAEHGEERTAQPGDALYQVGDREYPFIAILEGEAKIEDPSGHEIVRQGPSGFLGELNL